MRIKRMTATFGKLERAELTLTDGLNVIYAPNEAGKSTWCGFLRAMFYGVETSQRDKKGFLAEKNRYAPWSGAPMEGEVELEWQGRDVTLRRFAKGNTPFGGFSAVYSDTQQPVPGLTGETCGQTLLGVGRGVWERSAFVGQAPTLAIDGTPELERRIAALFSSGQEDVSYSDTRETLGKWLRRRRHNKSGLIPQMEEELAGLDAALTKLEDTHDRFARAQLDISRLEGEQRRLEGELHVHKRLAVRKLNARYAEAERQRQNLADELARAERELAAVPTERELLDARQGLGRLDALREEELRQRALHSAAATECEQAARDCPDHPLLQLTRGQMDDLCQLVQQMQSKSRTLSRLRFVCLAVALCLGVGVSMLPLPVLHGAVGPAIGAGVAVLTAVGAFIPMSVAAGGYRRRAQEVLAQYEASSAAALAALWQERQGMRSRLEQAENRLRQNGQEYEQARQRLSAEEETLNNFVRAFAPETAGREGCERAIDRGLALRSAAQRLKGELEQAQRRCDDLKAQGAQEIDTLEQLYEPVNTLEQTQHELARVEGNLTAARSALALAQGEMLSVGDRAELEARREALCIRLDRRRTEYAAIEGAIAALDEANNALQQRFAPQLNQLAGEILGQLTGGRYEGVALNREFEAAARSADGLLPRSTLALSRGTADQIYLAVRLAVCRLCLPNEDAGPVVLDDALLTFDDARMTAALEVLARLDRQVLLFSCQRREAQTGIGSVLSLQS
ncbi:MAG: AAA family ATPase [Oscillospiraceae bacterium]|nr:AAA family ATPase [Oscillospiraceae bacterium]